MSFVTVDDEVGLEDFVFSLADSSASVAAIERGRKRQKKKTMMVYTAGVLNTLATCYMVAGVQWAWVCLIPHGVCRS